MEDVLIARIDPAKELLATRVVLALQAVVHLEANVQPYRIERDGECAIVDVGNGRAIGEERHAACHHGVQVLHVVERILRRKRPAHELMARLLQTIRVRGQVDGLVEADLLIRQAAVSAPFGSKMMVYCW